MRWPWEWWRDRHVAEQRAPNVGDVDQAVAVRESEERGLAADRARRPDVAELAERLRQHRQTNHFAELFLGGETH
ncbi:hypothetical protein ACTOB_001260 [Actinoplanes oblitus]|uniref:Uncharacterized protein n=1 Tax=Actinoplanes oblitus TaxID=3040509 RepID=A0ABY8WJY5_9ACTN|nr:hypothetical protein [Actinoplanes oblitus]WIM97712.1 hypothetical protein ACTOB_001260 [Actinoplanes oblitus]